MKQKILPKLTTIVNRTSICDDKFFYTKLDLFFKFYANVLKIKIIKITEA